MVTFKIAELIVYIVGLVATKSHACYLLGGSGWDWVRILLGLNFSGSAGGVSGHA